MENLRELTLHMDWMEKITWDGLEGKASHLSDDALDDEDPICTKSGKKGILWSWRGFGTQWSQKSVIFACFLSFCYWDMVCYRRHAPKYMRWKWGLWQENKETRLLHSMPIHWNHCGWSDQVLSKFGNAQIIYCAR